MRKEKPFRKAWGVVLGVLVSCGYTAQAYDGHFYLGVDLTKSYGTLGDDDPAITYYQGYFTDAYPLNSSRSSTATIGLKSGYEFSGAGLRPAIAVGLGLYTTPNTYRYTGQLVETPLGSPSNDLFDYSFRVRSRRIMAETQLTWTLANHMASFVELGVGPAWTRLMDYQEVSNTANIQPNLSGFDSHTNNTLAYQVGFGLSYAFNMGQDTQFQHERLAIGYRFVNLGNVSFASRGSDYPYTLSLGTLKTQDVYLNLSHYF